MYVNKYIYDEVAKVDLLKQHPQPVYIYHSLFFSLYFYDRSENRLKLMGSKNNTYYFAYNLENRQKS